MSEWIEKEEVLKQIDCWLTAGEYNYSNAIHYLKKRISSIKPKMELISVKDKSPEKTGTYIVYMADGFDVDVYIEPQHTWAFNQASITHWMPFELIPPEREGV